MNRHSDIDSTRVARRNRRLMFGLCGVVAGMTALAYAAVPFYELFCRVTGYGGTTQVAEAAPESISERTVRVRFNADINSRLPWRFRPVQREVTVRLGEENLAFYEAFNRSDRPVKGMATFNVTPLKAGEYFSKIHCFCFDEQTLDAGQSVDMPVSYFVDPGIAEDPNTRDVKTITLSYTFFRADDRTPDEVAESVR